MDSPRDWSEELGDIAREWLFSDVDVPQFPKVVVLPFENPDLFSAEGLEGHFSRVTRHRCISIGVDDSGASVGVMSAKLGAPAVALAVETLGRQGVETIVGVGYCGSLRPQIVCGDLVLPFASVRDDGTSARYAPEIYPAVADPGCFQRLKERCLALDSQVHEGIVWSTDALMLETDDRVSGWAKRGVIAVDMEVGALFTVARLRNIRASAILVASDSPVLKLRSNADSLARGARHAEQAAMMFAFAEAANTSS